MTLSEAIAYMKQAEAMERFIRYNHYINPTYLHTSHGIHGINHTKRVLFLFERLAEHCKIL